MSTVKIIQVNEDISLKDPSTAVQKSSGQLSKELLISVKSGGDDALKNILKNLTGCSLHHFAVTKDEIEEAYSQVSAEMVEIIKEAAENIRIFHEKQLRTFMDDNGRKWHDSWQKITPLDSVGVYVPGGTAAYPSSVLMNVIPAKVAGVEANCHGITA